jgi:hypothetical protein
MRIITELNEAEARSFFLKSSSYCNLDLPKYICFNKILKEIEGCIGKNSFNGFKADKPGDFSGVNYKIIANKDGKISWRPYELMHPLLYVSLVNLICEKENWTVIKDKFNSFRKGVVECCSVPVLSDDEQSDSATQVINWWQEIEQKSLIYSLEYSHILHSDVTDCYGSIYTHSISWALHGYKYAKIDRNKKSLLGNQIDYHIQSGRYGQTNGISQGSVLMDLIADIILGFVDLEIEKELNEYKDFKILRYRDDYRIFTNSDNLSEEILKVISDKLMLVGMKLGAAKTFTSENVVQGSVKPDKLSGMHLQDIGVTNAKTIQKQLLRIHSFSLKFPNSGALKRLLSDFHKKLSVKKIEPEDLEVQVAIATDIVYLSPATIPVVSGILSTLIALSSDDRKRILWGKVRAKMSRLPNNGYLDIWLQRVIMPSSDGIKFISNEVICNIVHGGRDALWRNDWITNKKIIDALDVRKILSDDIGEITEVIDPKEISLFTFKAFSY